MSTLQISYIQVALRVILVGGGGARQWLLSHQPAFRLAAAAGVQLSLQQQRRRRRRQSVTRSDSCWKLTSREQAAR
jgi:hypothetical protein